MSVLRDTCLALMVLAFLAAFNSGTEAIGWSDNFDDGQVKDGNPVTWTENFANHFPGTYDASSGDYLLSNAQNVGNNPGTMVSFVDGVNFTDSYVRAQGVLLPGATLQKGGHLGLLGRINTNPDIVGAYVLVLDPFGEMSLQRVFLGFPPITFATVNLSGIDAASDIVLELDILGDIGGNVMNGYAWRPGNSKPSMPQITFTDDDFFSDFLKQGPAGIVYSEFSGVNDTAAMYRYAEAQNTPFLEGDFNSDGAVDAADYALWRNELGAMYTQNDYNIWRANFGRLAGSGAESNPSAAVPEPTTLLLMISASARGRRRRDWTRTKP